MENTAQYSTKNLFTALNLTDWRVPWHKLSHQHFVPQCSDLGPTLGRIRNSPSAYKQRLPLQKKSGSSSRQKKRGTWEHVRDQIFPDVRLGHIEGTQILASPVTCSTSYISSWEQPSGGCNIKILRRYAPQKKQWTTHLLQKQKTLPVRIF